MSYDLEAARLKKDWAENPRWKGIKRGYTAEDVVRLRGSVQIEHTLARRGADKLWKLLQDDEKQVMQQLVDEYFARTGQGSVGDTLVL